MIMKTAFKMAMMLQEEGVFANVAVSPAVPDGKALIRTSYMATHTEEHLDRVLERLREGRKDHGTYTLSSLEVTEVASEKDLDDIHRFPLFPLRQRPPLRSTPEKGDEGAVLQEESILCTCGGKVFSCPEREEDGREGRLDH